MCDRIQIFLAHASEDKPVVITIYDRLLKLGYAPWLDEKSLLPGQNWPEEINRAIENSQIFIACLSSNSVTKSGYIQKELRFALNKYGEFPPEQIYLIPLRLDDCKVPDFQQSDLGIKLRDIHWADYWKQDGLKKLIRSIEVSRKKNPEEKLRELERLLNPENALESFCFDKATIQIQEARGLFGNRSEIIINKQKQKAELFREDLGANVILEMVKIPGGSFIMGSDKKETTSEREKPQRLVSLPTFYMGRYPVTQAQWRVIALSEKVERDLDPDPSIFKENYEGITRWHRPVERVSWNDAIEFCKRLSNKTKREYRLPSEAEWEYACRAGTMTPFHFGGTISTELANYHGNYTYGQGVKGEHRKQTTPVGYFKVANNFGLYDMHGNVWEWCEDDYHDNYEGAPQDGRPWIDDSDKSASNVLRGGSWFFIPRICRCATRLYLEPGISNGGIGFRVAVGLAART